MSERKLLQLRELSLLHAQMQFIGLYQLRQLVHHALHLLHARSAQPLVHIESFQADLTAQQRRRAHRERTLRRLVVRHHYSLSTAYLSLSIAHRSCELISVITEPPRAFKTNAGAGKSLKIFWKSYASQHSPHSYVALQLCLANHHVASRLIRRLAEVVFAFTAVLHHVDRLDAARFAQLDHSQTHRRGGVVLKNHIATLQRDKVGEKTVSDTRRIQKNRAEFRGQTFRDGKNVVLRYNDLLSPGSYSSEREKKQRVPL